jgi:hypothetical protein
MRKRSKQQSKAKLTKSDDAAAEAVVGVVAGVALFAVFGGLAVAFGWKAIVAGASL